MDLGQGQPMINLIKDRLIAINPKQVLYFPYCRTRVPEGEENVWGEGWFARSMANTGIEVLEAHEEEDIRRADNPVIVISGGHEKEHALRVINEDARLKELIMNASVYIGESAGSMIAAEYICIDRDALEIIPGLGILKDTIIEPHYSEKKRQKQLRREVDASGAKYGLGIDCVTGAVFEVDQFPESYETIGNGSIEIITT